MATEVKIANQQSRVQYRSSSQTLRSAIRRVASAYGGDVEAFMRDVQNNLKGRAENTPQPAFTGEHRGANLTESE